MKIKSPYMPIEMKERTCLRCSKTFASTGPGNRICPKCNKTTIKVGLRDIVPGGSKRKASTIGEQR